MLGIAGHVSQQRRIDGHCIPLADAVVAVPGINTRKVLAVDHYESTCLLVPGDQLASIQDLLEAARGVAVVPAESEQVFDRPVVASAVRAVREIASNRPEGGPDPLMSYRIGCPGPNWNGLPPLFGLRPAGVIHGTPSSLAGSLPG